MKKERVVVDPMRLFNVYHKGKLVATGLNFVEMYNKVQGFKSGSVSASQESLEANK